MSAPDRLPPDEQFVLAHWGVEALADELQISYDAAKDLLEAAYSQGRVQMIGNSSVAGVQVDGRWVVVESRARITEATREWLTLRHMQRQLDD
jgi:hypothetical protein